MACLHLHLYSSESNSVDYKCDMGASGFLSYSTTVSTCGTAGVGHRKYPYEYFVTSSPVSVGNRTLPLHKTLPLYCNCMSLVPLSESFLSFHCCAYDNHTYMPLTLNAIHIQYVFIAFCTFRKKNLSGAKMCFCLPSVVGNEEVQTKKTNKMGNVSDQHIGIDSPQCFL